jgi:hypothetical protein
MLPFREEPATIDRWAKAENNQDPFSRWLALWRWDDRLVDRYKALRNGDPEMAKQKASDHAKAIDSANEALTRLDGIKEKLESDAYKFLRFKLEQNRFYLNFMGIYTQV